MKKAFLLLLGILFWGSVQLALADEVVVDHHDDHKKVVVIRKRPHHHHVVRKVVVVHHDALSPEQYFQSPPAKARPLLCDAAQPIADELVIGRFARFVSYRWPRAVRKAAGLPFTQAFDLERPHRFFAR